MRMDGIALDFEVEGELEIRKPFWPLRRMETAWSDFGRAKRVRLKIVPTVALNVVLQALQ